MILNLSVENYIIIKKINLDFNQGFSCFTGETGAGKSLVIDAIGILLGDRLSTDMILKGANKLRIEATIDITNNPDVKEQLTQAGYDNEILIVSREISMDNRSIARINGRSTTVSLIKELVAPLIDIHSQHDNQYLLNKKYHLELLDRYINRDELQQLKLAYNNYRNLADELYELKNKKYSQSELEYLQFQVQEIENLKLEEGEIEALENRLQQIGNYERTVSRLNLAIDLLENHNVKESLWQAAKELDGIHDEELQVINEALKTSFFELDEAYRQIVGYRNRLDYSEQELNEIQNRLFEIKKIQRKFGSTYTSIQLELEKMLQTINEISNSEAIISALEKATKAAYDEFEQQALVYREIRKTAAKALESAVQSHLHELDLPYALVLCNFEEKPAAADGLDHVEFLISMNKNIEPKPLIKAASGGELSRMMLGMKIIFASLYGNQCVIFDEIDTGVSGTTAFSIGRKMQTLAKSMQVISITHLAQVAACAADHFFVNKLIIDNQTQTKVELLNNEQRIEQLALLGVGMVNADSLKAAELLLQQGQAA